MLYFCYRVNKEAHKQFVRNTALGLGFMQAGIAKAGFLSEDARRLERWLDNGHHGEMSYMANHFDLRTDPSRLVPGAKSVITLLYNYYPEEKQKTGIPKVSKYAYGTDYHLVIRKKLQEFLALLSEKFGDVHGRGFVDSAPVLERSWAVKSGLGWIGKNGNLLNKQSGSFFFIATLITDLELEPDLPFATDHCGTCTKCIDSCPTDAILPNKVIDGSKCISYYTIELKNALPAEAAGKLDDWIFGCDVCQDVCPWNRFSKSHEHEELKPLHEILNFSLEDWKQLTEESFKKIFKDSPIKRTKYSGIMRNFEAISKTKNHES